VCVCVFLFVYRTKLSSSVPACYLCEQTVSFLQHAKRHPFTNGGPNRENSQGKDLGGFKEYLEGIWGNPTLVKKTMEKHAKSTSKPTKSVGNIDLLQFS